MSQLAIVTNHLDASGTNRFLEMARVLDIDAKAILLTSPTAVEDINSSPRVIFRISPMSFAICVDLLPSLIPSHRGSLKKCLDAFDKDTSSRVLASAGVSMPITKTIKAAELVNEQDFPFVVKVTRGNRGDGVYLVKAQKEIDEITELYPRNQSLIYQEYIAESRGRDKRLFVVGTKVVAAMQRVSTNGDFRANIHVGGVATTYTPTPEEELLAISAVQALGLIFAGVDIIDSDHGALVLEVNPSPGLAIEGITGVNIAEMIIKETLRGYND